MPIANCPLAPRRGRWREPGLKAVCLALTLMLAVPAASTDAPDTPDAPFKVIVNAKVAGTAVPRGTLAHIYLGRVKRWSDGRPIAAVDLPSNSPVRIAFTTRVLDMTMLAVRAHWMQLLPAGDRPPLTRTSDDAVIGYVASQPGGVGYVSEGAVLPDSVKTVNIE